MPVTPFHLGPGALIKAGGGEHVSFTIFAGSQVLMDIEPLVHMMRGDAVLHGPTHSLVGATVIGLLSALIGRRLSPWLLDRLEVRHGPIGWRVALLSGLVGTWSHVGLDAIMHVDMKPLWPFAAGNALLGIISVAMLHWLCVVFGIVGGAVIAVRTLRNA